MEDVMFQRLLYFNPALSLYKTLEHNSKIYLCKKLSLDNTRLFITLNGIS